MQAFFAGEIADPRIEVSADGFTWSAAQAARGDFSKGSGDYGYYKAVRYDVTVPPGQAFVRVTFAGPMQVGRIELDSTTGGPAR